MTTPETDAELIRRAREAIDHLHVSAQPYAAMAYYQNLLVLPDDGVSHARARHDLAMLASMKEPQQNENQTKPTPYENTAGC